MSLSREGTAASASRRSPKESPTARGSRQPTPAARAASSKFKPHTLKPKISKLADGVEDMEETSKVARELAQLLCTRPGALEFENAPETDLSECKRLHYPRAAYNQGGRQQSERVELLCAHSKLSGKPRMVAPR